MKGGNIYIIHLFFCIFWKKSSFVIDFHLSVKLLRGKC